MYKKKAYVGRVHLSANQKLLFSDFIFVKKYATELLNIPITLTTYYMPS